jgi:hypothetical protein
MIPQPPFNNGSVDSPESVFDGLRNSVFVAMLCGWELGLRCSAILLVGSFLAGGNCTRNLIQKCLRLIYFIWHFMLPLAGQWRWRYCLGV